MVYDPSKMPNVKVVWSDELLTSIKLRDDQCNLLEVVLGEPDEFGYYVPTMITKYEDNPLRDALLRVTELEDEIERYWRKPKR